MEVFKPAQDFNEHDALVDLVLEVAARVRRHLDELETTTDLDQSRPTLPTELRLPSRREPFLLQPHPKVEMALQEVERRCTDSALRLGHVSVSVGLSPAYLDKLLKRDTALGFSDHLRRARVALAERRLVRNNEPIKAVALTVGFSHVSTFNRAFARVHGCSPTQWKARNVVGQRALGAS